MEAAYCRGALIQTMPAADQAVPARAVRRESGILPVSVERTVLLLIGTVHRLAYRASAGRLGRTVRGGPVLLLTTIGRRSGREQTWPLCYVQDGEALVVVASAGGARQHPSWYLNLRARRRVSVQVGNQTRSMLARTAEGRERARLWERVVRHYPICADYQRRAGRLIPVVVLELIPPGNGSLPRRWP